MKRKQKKNMKAFKVSLFESTQNVRENNHFRKRIMMIVKAFESKQKSIMNNIIIFKIHFANFEKLPKCSKNEIFESRASELVYFISSSYDINEYIPR